MMHCKAMGDPLLFLSDYRRMPINIEFFLAGHPFLFLGREGGIKGFDCDGILTAISGGTGDVHPVFTFQRPGNQFCHQQGRGEIAGDHKADILLFAADKSTADIVAGISKIDVHIVAHIASHLKGMLDQDLAKLLPLIFRRNTQRAE